MEDTQNTLTQTLECPRPPGQAFLDAQLLSVIQSRFFEHYLHSTEQMLMILDHQTMNYGYVSDNFHAITGHSTKIFYAGGRKSMVDFLHPDDALKFRVITKLFQDTLSKLTRQEILRCGFSHAYRFAYRDGTYHHLLQHNIPLTLDEDDNLAHVLIILTDVSAYKRELTCSYRMVLHSDNHGRQVLLNGSIGQEASGSITRREKDIISLTAEGFTEKEIADKLHISTHTVKNHRKNLFRKTGVKNAIELVKFCSANLII